LISPISGADLLLYVSVTETIISAVLVQEQETNHSKYQVPVYYVSEALSGSKVYYFEIEKIAYTVLTASKKVEALLLGPQNQSSHKLPFERSITKLQNNRKTRKIGSRIISTFYRI
jgi:hypothetical protein